MRILVTGGAGFIGSHLVEALVKRGHRVRVLDDLSSGSRRNLQAVRKDVELLKADCADIEAARRALRGIEVVYHQAAVPSVTRSVENPLLSHQANATATVALLTAARDAGARRVVYAGSSSVYGDQAGRAKREEMEPRPLSPYAAAKLAGEHFLRVFAHLYGMETLTLRYFNVFGPRQDPDGPYASVIPAWIGALLRGQTAYINGDGTCARDFCHVDNVVQMNLRAALTADPAAVNQPYNVAHGEMTSLRELFELIREVLGRRLPHLKSVRAMHREARRGDMHLSKADIGKAQRLLGYEPTVRVMDGLESTMDWYIENLSQPQARRVVNV
jgi:UDP-N-acetylglucosamine 4-epimerase